MYLELFNPEQVAIITQIIFIDLILAGDNAIIIGMIASKFPLKKRKKIIFWGISGAVILRIILTMLTAYLLQIPGLRLIGGLLLIYIIYKIYKDVIKISSVKKKFNVDEPSLLKAIWVVLLADFTMSLDNVLGVAGAAGDHYYLLIFGLTLSIILMAVAANLISEWIKKYRWIAWVGLLAIFIVAIELIYGDIKIILDYLL
jgi:YjbE family integral membrane protein